MSCDSSSELDLFPIDIGKLTLLVVPVRLFNCQLCLFAKLFPLLILFPFRVQVCGKPWNAEGRRLAP